MKPTLLVIFDLLHYENNCLISVKLAIQLTYKIDENITSTLGSENAPGSTPWLSMC